MSSESIKVKFGEAVKIRDHIVQVNHVATKQQYVISKKDSANEMVCFPSSDDNVVKECGFRPGKLIIQDWKLSDMVSIDISEGENLSNIVEKINATAKVRAFVLLDQGGKRIIVESLNSGEKHAFHLAGEAIADLKVEVPQDAVRSMDIYNLSCNAFRAAGQMHGEEEYNSFQVGVLQIGFGFAEVQVSDIVSLNWIKQRINSVSSATNIKANIVLVGDHDHCILRLTTKLDGSLGYTHVNNGVLRGDPDVQIKFSAAQNTDITVDNIPSTSDSYDVMTSVIGNLHIEAIGDDVYIS
jgi:hypothetical protein